MKRTTMLVWAVLCLGVSNARGQYAVNPLNDPFFGRDATSFKAEDERLKYREGRLATEAQALGAEGLRLAATHNELLNKASTLAAEQKRLNDSQREEALKTAVLDQRSQALKAKKRQLDTTEAILTDEYFSLDRELKAIEGMRAESSRSRDRLDRFNSFVRDYNARATDRNSRQQSYNLARSYWQSEMDQYKKERADHDEVVANISRELSRNRNAYVNHDAAMASYNRAKEIYDTRRETNVRNQITAKNDRQDLNRKASALSGRAKARGDTFYYDNSPGGGKGSPPPFNPLSGNPLTGNPLSGSGLGSPSPAPTGNPLTGNPLSGNPLTGNPPSNVSENPLVGTRSKPPSPPASGVLGNPVKP